MIWREALGNRELSPILHGKRSFFGESPSYVIRFRRLAPSKRASWACHHAVEPSCCSTSKDSQVVQLSFGRQSSREMNQRRWSRERNSRSSNPLPSIGHRHLSGPGLDEMRRLMSCDNNPPSQTLPLSSRLGSHNRSKRAWAGVTVMTLIWGEPGSEWLKGGLTSIRLLDRSVESSCDCSRESIANLGVSHEE